MTTTGKYMGGVLFVNCVNRPFKDCNSLTLVSSGYKANLNIWQHV